MKHPKRLIGVIVLVVLAGVAGLIMKTKASSNSAPLSLSQTGHEVLVALRDNNYRKLEGLVSLRGLSLSKEPSINLHEADVSKEKVSDIPKDKEKRLFGYTDGKGDPIMLSVADFMKKYIYTHDYLNAKDVAENKTLGRGNSVNNIVKDAAGRVFLAYHFDGFDPKYEGMDWTTLYLIFDMENDMYKLRGIAKDNWTI
jgi:hypothetical protein